MKDSRERSKTKEELWRHSFTNALYGLRQSFEGACRKTPDLDAARKLHELSVSKVEALFEEVLQAAAARKSDSTS